MIGKGSIDRDEFHAFDQTLGEKHAIEGIAGWRLGFDVGHSMKFVDRNDCDFERSCKHRQLFRFNGQVECVKSPLYRHFPKTGDAEVKSVVPVLQQEFDRFPKGVRSAFQKCHKNMGIEQKLHRHPVRCVAENPEV